MKYNKLMWHQVESNQQLISRIKIEIIGIIRDARGRHYFQYDWKGTHNTGSGKQ